MISVSEYDLRS